MLDAISGASDGVGADGNVADTTFEGVKDDAVDCVGSSTGTSADAGDDNGGDDDEAGGGGDAADDDDDDEDDDDTSVLLSSTVVGCVNDATVSTGDNSDGPSVALPEDAVVNNTSTSFPVTTVSSGVGPAVTPSASSVRHRAIVRWFILPGSFWIGVRLGDGCAMRPGVAFGEP